MQSSIFEKMSKIYTGSNCLNTCSRIMYATADNIQNIKNFFKYDEIQYHFFMFHLKQSQMQDLNKIVKRKRIQFHIFFIQSITGIKPKNTDWEIEDCLYFQNLTTDKSFVSRIDNIVVDANSPETNVLELTLIDVTTEIDVYINQSFILDGRAISY